MRLGASVRQQPVSDCCALLPPVLGRRLAVRPAPKRREPGQGDDSSRDKGIHRGVSGVGRLQQHRCLPSGSSASSRVALSLMCRVGSSEGTRAGHGSQAVHELLSIHLRFLNPRPKASRFLPPFPCAGPLSQETVPDVTFLDISAVPYPGHQRPLVNMSDNAGFEG